MDNKDESATEWVFKAIACKEVQPLSIGDEQDKHLSFANDGLPGNS